ncbi:threonine synthase [Pendulispora brunnea]|uniref:Threonine synthase n=1 Tax=Pendulispora brunnea TaxID=2905690 RepID=A0ABZ2KA57_9BACT
MNLEHVVGLACLESGTMHSPDVLRYGSPNPTSELGFSPLDVRYDYAVVKRKLGSAEALAMAPLIMQSFAPLLPIPDASYLSTLLVGGTPLLRSSRLSRELGVELFVKDDSRNPSGSLKDRASALAVAHARFFRRDKIAVASTGNAAASLASQAASAGLTAIVFVPAQAPIAKIMQAVMYGSRVYTVNGNYDAAYEVCQRACECFGWYNRSTGYNPYMTEGKKTVSFEMAIQFARLAGTGAPMSAPDAVFVPVGDGCIAGAVHKGFDDLLQLGFLERMPRIYGVQSDKSAAIHRAWVRQAPIRKVNATSRADSICADMPRDGAKALRAIRETGGSFLAVSDGHILKAIVDLARKEGIFVEPAAAASLAGLCSARAQGLVRDGEKVVLLLTGSGLKDPLAGAELLAKPLRVSTLDDVKKVEHLSA